jgi:hypothetical protein
MRSFRSSMHVISGKLFHFYGSLAFIPHGNIVQAVDPIRHILPVRDVSSTTGRDELLFFPDGKAAL